MSQQRPSNSPACRIDSVGTLMDDFQSAMQGVLHQLEAQNALLRERYLAPPLQTELQAAASESSADLTAVCAPDGTLSRRRNSSAERRQLQESAYAGIHRMFLEAQSLEGQEQHQQKRIRALRGLYAQKAIALERLFGEQRTQRRALIAAQRSDLPMSEALPADLYNKIDLQAHERLLARISGLQAVLHDATYRVTTDRSDVSQSRHLHRQHQAASNVPQPATILLGDGQDPMSATPAVACSNALLNHWMSIESGQPSGAASALCLRPSNENDPDKPTATSFVLPLGNRNSSSIASSADNISDETWKCWITDLISTEFPE